MKQTPQLISYLTIRKAIGVLGLALPPVLVLGSILFGSCKEIQSSISAYYYTNMRDVFVGILSAVALFLFAYKGYEKQDSIISNFGALFALGIILCPTSLNSGFSTCISLPVNTGHLHTFHLISAALLLLVLAYFSLFLFTKSFGVPSERKKMRNIIYRICGIVILLSILLNTFIFIFKNELTSLLVYKPVFWLETIALWAFGISWLVKGNALLKDLDLE